MKLSSLHNEQGILASEGMLDNLGKGGRAKLQAAMLHPTDTSLRSLVAQAKELDGAIWEESDTARNWWVQLLDHYSIPEAAREDCIRHVSAEIQRKVMDYLSDQREAYLHGMTGSRGQRKTAFAKLLSQLATDRRNIHQEAHDVDAWSNGVKMRAVNELAAVLAIKGVERYAHSQKNSPQQPQQQQADPNKSDAQKQAQQLAERLWRLAAESASGRAQLSPRTARAYIDKLKELGFKVRWQGRKSEKFPNGDRPPIAVQAQQ